MKRAALIAVLIPMAAAAVAPTASAWTPPGDRPAINPLVDQAVAISENYWTERGMHPCPVGALNVRFASDLSDGQPWVFAVGRGELNGCRIWLLDSLVADAQSHPPGNHWAEYLCRTTTIELGHTAGLDDDYGSNSVMDPTAAYRQGTPAACRAWGADQRQMFKLVREHRQRFRACRGKHRARRPRASAAQVLQACRRRQRRVQ